MTSISTMLTNLTTSLQHYWTATPSYLRNTAILSLSTLSLLTISFLGGYRRWLALGAGGLPYNLKGYVMNLVVEWRFAEGDTVGLGVYEGKEAAKRFEKWGDVGGGEREVVSLLSFSFGPCGFYRVEVKMLSGNVKLIVML